MQYEAQHTPLFHAIILAGGAGRGLAPLPCTTCCKPLLPVRGEPMLHYALRAALRAGAWRVTVVAPPGHVEDVSACVRACKDGTSRKTDQVAGAAPRVAVVAVAGEEGVDSADALRAVIGQRSMGEDVAGENAPHTLVIPGDLVTNADLEAVVRAHFESRASCTVALAHASGVPGPKFTPQVHTIIDPSGSRLLGIVEDEELERAILRVRMPLLQRFPELAVRADLEDSHIYIFAPWVVQRLLPTLPQISSVKLDLIPYLARRQFSLARQAHLGAWESELPQGAAGDVKVALHVLPEKTYIHRTNTVRTYLSTSLDVATGILDQSTTGDAAGGDGSGVAPAHGKEKKKGKPAKGGASPFDTVGERVNVSVDSYVGMRSSAGDRTTVKKSCVGGSVSLGAGVKVNGTVILDDVVVNDGASLAGCVVGAGAVIGKGCTLKDCRVAFGVLVEDDTHAVGEDMTGVRSAIMDDFEFS
jgi:translation initiation factor eIF-2B subunit gamma